MTFYVYLYETPPTCVTSCGGWPYSIRFLSYPQLGVISIENNDKHVLVKITHITGKSWWIEKCVADLSWPSPIFGAGAAVHCVSPGVGLSTALLCWQQQEPLPQSAVLSQLLFQPLQQSRVIRTGFHIGQLLTKPHQWLDQVSHSPASQLCPLGYGAELNGKTVVISSVAVNIITNPAWQLTERKFTNIPGNWHYCSLITACYCIYIVHCFYIVCYCSLFCHCYLLFVIVIYCLCLQGGTQASVSLYFYKWQ